MKGAVGPLDAAPLDAPSLDAAPVDAAPVDAVTGLTRAPAGAP